MNKKKLLSLALVVVLIATISFGTLAWFNDKDEVTNTFMVANSGEPTDPDDIFSVDVKEIVDTNGDGDSKEVAEGDDTVGGTYKDILPGDELVKEPIIVNTGAYPQYVRAKVIFSDAADWQELIANGKLSSLTDLLVGIDSDWLLYGEPETVNDTITFTYYLERILEVDDEETLFTHVKIPEKLDQADMAKIGKDFTITVVAEAVQTENVGSNALEAFTTVMGG